MVAIARDSERTPEANFDPPSHRVEIRCEDLELPRLDVLFREKQPAQVAALGAGELAELTRSVDVREQPDQKPLVHAGGVDWPVALHEISGPWALISDRSAASWGPKGFDFAGWVPRTSVRPGGLRVVVDVGRVPIRTVHRTCGAKLRLTPTLDAKPVARLADEVPVVVVGHELDFANVLLPDLRATPGGRFWIHRSGVCAIPAR